MYTMDDSQNSRGFWMPGGQKVFDPRLRTRIPCTWNNEISGNLSYYVQVYNRRTRLRALTAMPTMGLRRDGIGQPLSKLCALPSAPLVIIVIESMQDTVRDNAADDQQPVNKDRRVAETGN